MNKTQEELELEEEFKEIETSEECDCAVRIGYLQSHLVLGVMLIMFLSFWVYMAYRNDERKLVNAYLSIPASCKQKLYGYLREEVIDYECAKQIEVKLIERD